MTIRDIEVVELLAHEPELLAIADAVSATQTELAAGGSRRSGRLALRASVAAAAAAAVIVGILAAPQSESGIIGRALAAIGEGRIMHVVTEFRTGSVLVDLKTGRRHVQVFREEMWADRQFRRFHFVMSLQGHVVGDLLWPKDARKGDTGPSLSPGFVALWTGYRAALKNGTATVAGRGTAYGHSVYWIRFKGTTQGQPDTEVGVDAHTYKPLLYRWSVNGFHFDQRILVAKAIPYRPSEFARRGPSLLGGTSHGSSRSGVVGPEGSSGSIALHAPWLTAGSTVAGLELRSAYRYTEEFTNNGSKKHETTGVELTYGSSTIVDELPRPDSAGWATIPAGWVEIQIGTESSGNHGAHRSWTGILKKSGIYVTVQTPLGEHVLLEIARALHVAPKR